MATTLRVPLSVDLADLFRDLESVKLGLGGVMKDALREAGGLARNRTAELMPLGPGPQGGKDTLPHIKETLSASATQSYAQVVSDHPGAPVLNFGGSIAPRGVEIFFPKKLYAQQAGEEVLPLVESHLQDAVDRLTEQYLS
jgi:hypothetical protein